MAEKTTYEQLESVINDLKKTISEDTQIKKDLNVSLSQLKTVLDSTADGILVADGQGKIILFNKQFAKMWRIPDSILNTKNDEKALEYVLSQLVDPDKFLSKVNELYSNPEAESFDTFEFKDGRVFERFSQPHFLNDEIIGRVWSFRDVTRRKNAERALRDRENFLSTLLDTIPIPAFYKDTDGRYLGFNKAFEDFYGATKEGLIGKTVFDIDPIELAEISRAKDNGLFKSGGTLEYHSQAKNASGELRDAIFTKSTYTDKNGNIKGLIGTIVDITERKKANRERERLITELQKALSEVNALSGLLPICSYCKKIRDDKGYWQQIERYIQARSDTQFSHGICPECAEELYPDLNINEE